MEIDAFWANKFSNSIIFTIIGSSDLSIGKPGKSKSNLCSLYLLVGKTCSHIKSFAFCQHIISHPVGKYRLSSSMHLQWPKWKYSCLGDWGNLESENPAPEEEIINSGPDNTNNSNLIFCTMWRVFKDHITFGDSNKILIFLLLYWNHWMPLYLTFHFTENVGLSL